MPNPIRTAALAFLLCAAAGADAASSVPLAVPTARSPATTTTSSSRRLAWGWCWSFWSCPPPPPPGPKCAPCATPCPAGFKYTEDCAYWWWQSDTTACVPEDTPANAVAANTDVTQRGSCSFSFSADGEGKFGGDPDGCPSGFVDKGVTESKENCCQPPIWGDRGRRLRAGADNAPAGGAGRSLLLAHLSCSNPKTHPYGFFKTRHCVPKTPTTVFVVNEPSGGCPTWALQSWQTTFDTCSFCKAGSTYDADAITPAGQSRPDPCWLPYAKNSAGECFAYDAAGIGWWKKTGDRAYNVMKGGTEELMKAWTRN